MACNYKLPNSDEWISEKEFKKYLKENLENLSKEGFIKPSYLKIKENDKENITGVSGEVREGQKPLQAEPNQETSGEPSAASGNVQASEEGLTEGGGENPPPPNEEERFVGVNRESMKGLADRMGLDEIVAGEHLEPEQWAERGRKILSSGVDPNEYFKSDARTPDKLSVARAYLEQLEKQGDAIADKKSEEYKAIQEKINNLEKEVIQPILNEWHSTGSSAQGVREMNTDSFTSVARQIQQNTGKELTEEQTKKVQELTDKNKSNDQAEIEAESKLIDATDKEFSKKLEDKDKEIEALRKELATKRKARVAKVDAFFDKAIASVSNKGVAYAVVIPPEVFKLALKGMKEAYHAGEAIAKILEDATIFISDKIGSHDWDKDKFKEDYLKAFSYETKESPEAKRIAALEKQLSDLQEGKTKEKPTPRERTEQENLLKQQILEAKTKVGLIKAVKTEATPTDIKETLNKLQELFVGKKGDKFTQDESKAIWDYMKAKYLDKGVRYVDALGNVANDIGLSFDQVASAVVTPRTKIISDEMWKKRHDTNTGRNATKDYVEQQGLDKATKAFNKVVNTIREGAVFGHAGVFVGTHAGATLMNIVQVKNGKLQWGEAKHTVKAFFDNYKLAYGKEANYERMMESLKHSKQYDFAQRCGLKNNPDDVFNPDSEMADSEGLLSNWKWFVNSGKRGFNSIKILRQTLFENEYNRLPESIRSNAKLRLEAGKEIAREINLATGATSKRLPKWVNKVTFAGGMEVARWQKLVENPKRALALSLKASWPKSDLTPSERVFLNMWARRAGAQVATFMVLRAVNIALQNYFSPENKVVIDDKKQLLNNLLGFDFGDVHLRPFSGMETTANLLYGLALSPFLSKDERNNESVMEYDVKKFGKYARGKLAPAYSILADFVFKEDYNQNKMPFNHEQPDVYHHKLTWGEYLWQKAPIPVSEASRVYYDELRSNDVDKQNANLITNAMIYGGLSAATGFRSYENTYGQKSYEREQKKSEEELTSEQTNVYDIDKAKFENKGDIDGQIEAKKKVINENTNALYKIKSAIQNNRPAYIGGKQIPIHLLNSQMVRYNALIKADKAELESLIEKSKSVTE